MSQKWDVRFLQMTRMVSTWSKDPSTKTGAVITDGKRIVSLGYNGFPSKMRDFTEWWNNREEKYSRVVHCEINAMIQARQPLNGMTLYTWPFASCDRCAVQMIQAGITRFVFPEPSEDVLSRWGEALEKSKKYFRESGVRYTEIPKMEIE